MKVFSFVNQTTERNCGLFSRLFYSASLSHTHIHTSPTPKQHCSERINPTGLFIMSKIFKRSSSSVVCLFFLVWHIVIMSLNEYYLSGVSLRVTDFLSGTEVFPLFWKVTMRNIMNTCSETPGCYVHYRPDVWTLPRIKINKQTNKQ